MASLLIGQSSNCDNPIIDVFFRRGSILVDVNSLEYQIFDVSTPAKQATPVQVFPTSGRAVVNLNDCPTGQRLSQGRYVALFTPDTGGAVGTHRVKWFYKELPTSTEQTFTEEFEVLTSAAILPSNTYVGVDDIRAAGLDSTVASDAEVTSALIICQGFLERATGQWFESRTLTFKFDGNNSSTLNFGVPIINVTSLKINDSTTALDPTYYRVYNSSSYPDDRKNPRIALVRTSNSNIFSDPIFPGRLKFVKGWQNQEISGDFGYIESNGATPDLIKRALIKLTIQKLAFPLYLSPGSSAPLPPPPGPSLGTVREITDGHSISHVFGKPRDYAVGLSGITPDREVLDIIKLYRAPIGVAVPSNFILG